MKRTKNLQIRTNLSKRRQTLRQKLDAVGIEANRLKNQVFLSAEERQQAEEHMKRLVGMQITLQRELVDLARGSNAQLAAGWH